MKQHRSSFGRVCLLLVFLSLAGLAWARDMNESIQQALGKTPHPNSAADFHAVPSLPCLNQGRTLVCWSFATSSFLESEMARLKLKPVRLSVMYPVYCQYLEKARRYVQTRGESRFSPGDLFAGGFEVCRRYGVLPASVYDKLPSDKGLDQRRMYAELEDLMQAAKRQGKWDEGRILAQVKKILDRHLGKPPQTFSFQGGNYTAKSFAAEVVRLPWDEYLMVTSFASAPFNTFTELDVPDNWRHDTNFFNVPLPVFYDGLKGAVQAGFSVAVSMDNTEPSYKSTSRYCLIPDCDLSACNISQEARELRFLNGATEDDHAIHIIGWKDFKGEEWFLAKDSGKTAWREGNQGTLFLHGTYVKLKVLAFIVHRDGVPAIQAFCPPAKGR